MARRNEQQIALSMRLEGKSYSQIREIVKVSKSTLSRWLAGAPVPVPSTQVSNDRKRSRIEKTVATKRKRKKERLSQVLNTVSSNIDRLSDRDALIAGIFLYWGEGGKTGEATISLSNTDPAAIIFFMRWVSLLGVPYTSMRVYLHLYTDMDAEAELAWWSEKLALPLSAFRKPYIKKSTLSERHFAYGGDRGHGTCNMLFYGRDLHEYVMTSLEFVRQKFATP